MDIFKRCRGSGKASVFCGGSGSEKGIKASRSGD